MMFRFGVEVRWRELKRRNWEVLEGMVGRLVLGKCQCLLRTSLQFAKI